MKVFAVLGGELNPDTLIPDSNTQINKLARQSHPFLGAMKVQEVRIFQYNFNKFQVYNKKIISVIEYDD